MSDTTSHQIRLEVTDTEKIVDHQSNNINTHLLKALLKYAPTAEGMLVIATDIIAASEEENGLAQLAQFYTTGLILPSESSCNGGHSVSRFLMVRLVNSESKWAEITSFLPSETRNSNPWWKTSQPI